jgi:hypothetical protein
MISEFNTEAAKLQSQWQQQAETMTSQLDELSKQLHTSQGKLEVLQRTTVHVKDDKQVRHTITVLHFMEESLYKCVVVVVEMSAGDRENVDDEVRTAAC